MALTALRDDGPATYRAFDFRTSVGPSRQDAGLDVCA
jgi:hypothetical protein